MITDKETNFLYFSDRLKTDYQTFYKRFITLLNRLNIKSGEIPDTKDIWCRDYMPIQVDKDKFVQFD